MAYNGAFPLKLPDSPRARHAIHNRHLQIHENDGDVGPVRFMPRPEPRLLQRLERFLAVVCHRSVVAAVTELPLQNLLVDNIVFYDEHVIDRACLGNGCFAWYWLACESGDGGHGVRSGWALAWDFEGGDLFHFGVGVDAFAALDVEAEFASLASCRCDSDLAALHLGEYAGDE